MMAYSNLLLKAYDTHRLTVLSYAIALLCFTSFQVKANDNQTLRQQFIEYYSKLDVDANEIRRLLNAQTNAGTWPDVDYTSTRPSNWPTRIHLDRCVDLATAYVKPGAGYYRSEEVKMAIFDALNHWLEKDYQNPNWFNRRISIPRNISITLILLDGEVSSGFLASCRTILNRSFIGTDKTGQNLAWLSEVAFMKGLLYNNVSQMQRGSEEMWNLLQVTTEEGLQPDWSFHQHGPQQQFGNYGLSFVEGMAKFASFTRGTSYGAVGNKLMTLRNYVLKGLSWVLWKGVFDINSCGRQLYENNPRQKGERLTVVLKAMIDIDPQKAADYRKRIQANASAPIGFRHYWRSDLTVCRRPGWFASVKKSSTRIITGENVNNESIKSLHLSDGTLWLYKDGDEYENIQPLLDWKRLPGTTCDQGLTNLNPGNDKFGQSDFVGGVGIATGVSVLEYKRNQLSARKSWFFTKNTIVCLGAGINGTSRSNVFTSVEQSLYDGGAIRTSAGTLTGSQMQLGRNAWIHHNGTGYRMISPATVKKAHVKGNWQEGYPTYPDNPAAGDVFSIWIDHGVSPKNQTYAYKIYPKISAGALPGTIANDDLVILSNTASLQAVEDANTLYAVFYQAGTLRSSVYGNVQVNKPCVLRLGEGQLSVADPTHKLGAVEVRVGGNVHSVTLPTNKRHAGRQVIVPLKNASLPSTTTLENSSKISLYPMPVVHGVLHVDGVDNKTSFKVTDFSGRTTKTGNVLGHQIDLSGLNSGTYILLLDQEGGKSTSKHFVIP
ncbi:MAG: polysaccharide lyase family 8 super-sandwich domain-containing protein [Bacteroidota bacterium]